MNITKKIIMSLDRWDNTIVVDAVQDDSNTRAVSIALTSAGQPWQIPAGATAAIRFKKADGKVGLYDTLPNNEPAYVISDNVVTVTLVPEVLTVDGAVDVSVALYNGSSMVGTFPFVVNVAPNPAAGQVVSNNYYYLKTCDAIIKAFEGQIESDYLSLEYGDFETIAKKLASGSMPVVVIDGTYSPDGNVIGEIMTAATVRMPNSRAIECVFCGNRLIRVRITSTGAIGAFVGPAIQWAEV